MPKRSLKLSLFRTADSDHFYHVVLRCHSRELLATTAKDRRALNTIAIDTIRRYDVKLHAYCLMTGHLRALIEVDPRVVIEVLRRVAIQYSRYRNQATAGNLFERPYTARRIDTDSEFLDVLRNIHLNPVVANKVVLPADYPWSSHRAYLGYKSNALITTDYGLSLLAADRSAARAAYHHYISEGIASDVICKEGVTEPSGSADGNGEPPLPASALIRDECPSVNPNLLLTEVFETGPRTSGRTRERRRSRRFLSVY